MEMTSAGLVADTFVDSHIADLWAKIFKNIHVSDDIKLSKNNQISRLDHSKTPHVIGNHF